MKQLLYSVFYKYLLSFCPLFYSLVSFAQAAIPAGIAIKYGYMFIHHVGSFAPEESIDRCIANAIPLINTLICITFLKNKGDSVCHLLFSSNINFFIFLTFSYFIYLFKRIRFTLSTIICMTSVSYQLSY